MCLYTTICFAQQEKTNVQVIDVDKSKTELYSKALSFFAYYFKSANDVIQMKDETSGIVIGKGIVDDRNVTITIECKDGKYRQTIEMELLPFTFKDYPILTDKKLAGYKTTTYVTLVWNGNGLEIPTSSIFIRWNQVGNEFTRYYTEINSGKIPLPKQFWETWLQDVNNEIIVLKNKYNQEDDISSVKNQRVIESVTSSLKSHMTLENEW